MQWSVIFKKELLENWRNFKWIWVPIVFILFGIMDPITTYYMPKIIDAVGGLPEGAQINIPQPPPEQALLMSINEYSSLGVLMIVLITMGIISGEKKSGVAELILSRPVSFTNYITAKWASSILLILVSFITGMMFSWYYVNLLFGDLSLSQVFGAIFIYGFWLILVVSITMLISTLFKIPGLVGFISVLIVIFIHMLTSIFRHILTYSPANLSSYVSAYLYTGEMTADMWSTIFVTLIGIVLLLTSSIFILRNREI
ncbi:ABC-2 type transport system permease protein [Melghiribacillus thermohalophilus]|uniref:ABC-2 type transport system permease protein n=1 Tax=Melghiribacillus thermohalophilus TaxID=1324956 RepID=A0A4R3MR57_9BACI|nr:ABC-2 type transport system permease protein [Melghiribacillus thermohalophilus]